MLRSITLALSILIFGFYPIHHARAQAAVAAAATIGQTLDGLRTLAKQLEDSASFLIAQGNNALAQQQMLLAGIIRSTIEQMAAAYADSLNKTFAQVNVAEQNTFNDLIQITGQLSKLENKTAQDVQAIIYKTQGAANQVLNRLPIGKKVPVFYGVTARDMMADPSQSPADLEILGFLFSDDRLSFKKPIIKVADQVVEERFVSVQEDRIQVQIPDPIKQKIGFGASPCNPRKTFQVTTEVFYAIPRGIWPIKWNKEENVIFNSNTLAGSERYDVVVTKDGVRTSVSQRQESFSQKSGNVTVGCEDNNAGAVRAELPSNATEINCTAGWVDTDNLKTQQASACTVGGTVASATGTVRGLDRDCLYGPFGNRIVCNCRGGGHGYLLISGTYKVPQTDSTPFSNVAAGQYVMANGQFTASLGTDSAARMTKVSVNVKRKDCGTILDTVHITLPENPLQGVSQSSEKGFFKATLRNGQLTVERTSP